MRLRSSPTEPVALRFNFLPGHSPRTAGGRWFNGKFMTLFHGPRGQDNAKITVATDGGRPANSEEEPLQTHTQTAAILTFEQNLERRRLSEASRQLRDREERLFGDITEVVGLKGHEKEEAVDRLASDHRDLREQVLQTLQQSLSLNAGHVQTEDLRSAVKVIFQEEEQDQLWAQRGQTPPDWRPSGYKKLHDATLCTLVRERMENPSTPPAGQMERSSLEADICNMGRQLMEDLQLVVSAVKTCYPPQTDICDFYARLYHETFRALLSEIADFDLGDKGCMYLLRWVNEYYPERLQKLSGDIRVEDLGKLLPADLLKPLEEAYLSNKQAELQTYISRILEEERSKWSSGEEPTREDGRYTSPAAYDIIQFVNGMVTSAAKVVGDLHKAQSVTHKLADLMQSFKAFQDEVIKQNRANSRAFIQANLSGIRQFRDVLQRNNHLFLEDVQKSCLRLLAEMKDSAHRYLLGRVHDVLRPQYRRLGTSDWLKKPQFTALLDGVEAEVTHLQALNESCHQELMCQFHQEVAVEYVRRLLKGNINLKDKEQEKKAYLTVRDEAESLHNFFIRKGSQEAWLREILTTIAEVLKLQDLPAIQVQVVSLGVDFPDLNERHVSALLKLKKNVSKADRRTVKETLRDALRDASVSTAQTFFSRVQVK